MIDRLKICIGVSGILLAVSLVGYQVHRSNQKFQDCVDACHPELINP